MKNNILKIFIGLFLLMPCMSRGENITVTGTVKDSDGKAFYNANVIVLDSSGKKTTLGTVSDENGNFNLTGVPSDAQIQVSFSGYERQTVKAGANLNITLQTTMLDAPTVTAKREGASVLTPRKITKIELVNTEKPSVDTLPSREQTNIYKSLCETESNKGTWDADKNTCNCPTGKVWEKSMGHCEDENVSAQWDACFEIKNQAIWDDELNECVCNDEDKEFIYDENTKTGKCSVIDTRTPEQKAKDLADKQSAYDAAKEKEQSLANRTLTAATTAAIGIGAMQALQGLSEQRADKDADADMAAYIATMRCSYGNVSRIDVGNEPIELPGGNNEALMNYRNEYFALAESLKVRKEALGMNPGIESEVILDKANMGLYDQENTGITSGNYASLYRAKMLNSEADKTKIEEDANKSGNRVKYGAIAAGVGVVGGLVGNSAINGKLGELIKEAKGNAANNRANKDVISKIKTALKNAGVKDINKLDFSNLDLSALSSVMDKIDFTKVSSDLKGKSALDILNTSNKTSFVSSFGDVLGESNLNLLNGL